MIRWCSYCQQYMDEIEPFDDYSMTHSTCNACYSTKIYADGENTQKARKLATFYSELRSCLRCRETNQFKVLLLHGLTLNLRPSDFIIGLMQPLMYEVGKLWGEGKIMVSDEHCFTRAISETIGMVHTSLGDFQEFRQHRNPVLVLTTGSDNQHTLGLQFVELVLMLNKIPTFTILESLSAKDLCDQLFLLKPKYLGLSLAVCSQFGKLVSYLEYLTQEPNLSKIQIVIGGSAVRWGSELLTSSRIKIFPTVQEFVASLA
ncbi:MAG: B12-binding domain-containing protein [Leptospiraceae bacterium]|nr:B12-binding domain-containing protein [Leptospiraceae bacterium]